MTEILRKIRWAALLLAVGAPLAAIGGSLSIKETTLPGTVLLVLGMPLVLAGFALKAAELAPVPVIASNVSAAELETLRGQATPTQRQIFQEVTRYQYGNRVHLELALEKLDLASEETGDHPTLRSIQETAVEGAYALVLVFGVLDIPYEVWQAKQAQMTKFFGPGVEVTTAALSSKQVAVTIVATDRG